MEHISMVFDHDSKKPLYLQLHDYLASEIAAGRIREGERLPGKRTAASMLGVSQITVDGAYQLLASEGYISSKPRSGFVVCRLESLEPPPVYDEPVVYRSRSSSAELSLLTADVDESLFPFRTWARLFKDTLYNRPDLLNHGDPCGDADLREAISLYLHHSRGAYCHADRIIIGAGVEYLMWLLCHLLPGRKAAMEDPGYPKIRQILAQGGMDVSFIPLDEQGMDPEALRKCDPDIAYMTPSHQFPTGTVTPAGRRTELLKWASEKPGRYVIEDDYDSEFRFDGRPMPCMQALDPRRVIYIGTFSRTIAPAIRIAYMVLPPELMDEYRRRFSFFSSTVSRFEQQTLCRYIADGHFGRSLNRARNRYHQRRDALVAEISRRFGDKAELVNTHTGLSFQLLPYTDRSETEIEQNAASLGLSVRGIGSYRLSDSKSVWRPCLVIGYGSLEDKKIPQAVDLLYRAIFE